MTSNQRFDVIFETVGKRRLKECLKNLKENGVLLLGSTGLMDTLLSFLITFRGTYRVVSGITNETPEDMQFVKELVEKGALKAVIDRVYSLDKIPEAHHYVEKGHKSGNVVVRV
jgi:NADPH:quinone reductase-like Zn-dependent oxidoreductase